MGKAGFTTWDRPLFSKYMCAFAMTRTISQRPLVKDSRARLHFVDDRFETLKAINETPDLKNNIHLYLADWCGCAAICLMLSDQATGEIVMMVLLDAGVTILWKSAGLRRLCQALE